MTSHSQNFLAPASATQRQYEALRSLFAEGLSRKAAAERFGHSLGSVRSLCAAFRKNPDPAAFFADRKRGPKPAAEEPDTARRNLRAITLRKRHSLSAGDICRQMKKEGTAIGAASARRILRQAGFSKLPRRSLAERGAALKPDAGADADATQPDLSPRRLRTEFGGLFLFVPDLVRLDLGAVAAESGMPGSGMIPAGHAFRSLLALKLWGIGRPPRIMADVLDPGIALFAGLSILPKRAALTECSSRVDPRRCAGLMDRWRQATQRLEVDLGGDGSFDLDFHTIPCHGDAAVTERRCVSKRSRARKGVLAFLARDADARLFCYANAAVRKQDQNGEILRFVASWTRRAGRPPSELIFDSRLTTHANLSQPDRMGISFVTLRRRTRSLLDAIAAASEADWRQVRLTNVGRACRTPRILDRTVRMAGYHADIRQIAVRDLGHEKPALLLTSQMTLSASQLIDRCARRMVIENAIAEAIDFFHMDALSAAVPMKIDLDLQLTLMANTLYRLLAVRLGNGRQTSKARALFRDFIKAAADIHIEQRRIIARIGRRANNPYLLNAGYEEMETAVPRLDNRTLRFQFV